MRLDYDACLKWDEDNDQVKVLTEMFAFHESIGSKQ